MGKTGYTHTRGRRTHTRIPAGMGRPAHL